MKRIVTRALILLAATLAIVFAQVAPASATASNKLAGNLAALWTAVLETAASQNPSSATVPRAGTSATARLRRS
jgi:hypothetical protein